MASPSITTSLASTSRFTMAVGSCLPACCSFPYPPWAPASAVARSSTVTVGPSWMVATGQLPDFSEKSGTFTSPLPPGCASGQAVAAEGTGDLRKIRHAARAGLRGAGAGSAARAARNGAAERSPRRISLLSTLPSVEAWAAHELEIGRGSPVQPSCPLVPGPSRSMSLKLGDKSEQDRVAGRIDCATLLGCEGFCVEFTGSGWTSARSCRPPSPAPCGR